MSPSEHPQVLTVVTRALRLVTCTLLPWLAPLGLPAQSLAVGRFEGQVHARDGRPLGDAEVRVVARAGGLTLWTLTTHDGRFRFDALPSGRYDVTVEELGFRPVVHLDVRVVAGAAVRLAATLSPATPPVSTVDTVRVRTAMSAPGQWLLDRGYADLPGTRRIGGDLAAFSVGADANGVEGLPWRMTSMLVDGARSSGAAAQAGSGADAAGLALPLRAVSSASVGGMGYDVELGGTGVGVRAATRPGGSGAGSVASAEGGSAALGGSFMLSGPIQGDTAQGLVGFDYQRNERDFWNEARNVDPRAEERASAFGRIDWRGSERLAIGLRASGGRFTSTGYGERTGLPSYYGSDYSGIAGQGSVNVLARLSSRVAAEWRFGMDVSRSEGSLGSRARGYETTDISRFGGPLGTPHRELRATPRLTALLHVDAGRHRLKMGVLASSQRAESEYVRDSDGQYVFGAAPGVVANAAWRGVQSADAGVVLRLRETAFLLQDQWQLSTGLELTLGLRMDSFGVPVSRIERNAEWLAQSGLDNSNVSPRTSAMSPRVGFRWELGENAAWVLEGGAGTFRDLPDVRDIAEAFTLDRAATVRYGVGTLPRDAIPSLSEAPVVGQTLTMLSPQFGGTRTERLSLGLSRALGSWKASISGVYRATDGLSRRRDLNLPAFAAGEDQDGRPLYGSLQQVGAAVVVTPQSNRRFSDFDAVNLLENGGRSEYWGLTVGVERVREVGLSLSAFYTHSQTTDNLPQLGRAQSSFPDGLAGRDWADGRSDLDVPHRAMVAVEWRSSDRLSIGGMYRLRSGLPFTPGFRDGVDANGDGDWTNDVAFVDAASAGMDAQLAKHSCLKAGAFAARNACRGEIVQSVDLRAAFRVVSIGGRRVDLVVDAVDLLALNTAPVDAALLLVDAAGTVTVNPGTGVTTLPYVVNPAFGERVNGRAPGVLWRVGLRVTQ